MNFEKTTIVPDEMNLKKTIEDTADMKDGIETISTTLHLKEKDMDISDIKNIVMLAMEYVENNTNLKGKIKEEFVVVITETLINKYVADPRLKEILLTIADVFVGDVVQLVIDASKGNLDINKSKIKRYFKCRRETKTTYQ